MNRRIILQNSQGILLKTEAALRHVSFQLWISTFVILLGSFFPARQAQAQWLPGPPPVLCSDLVAQGVIALGAGTPESPRRIANTIPSPLRTGEPFMLATVTLSGGTLAEYFVDRTSDVINVYSRWLESGRPIQAPAQCWVIPVSTAALNAGAQQIRMWTYGPTGNPVQPFRTVPATFDFSFDAVSPPQRVPSLGEISLVMLLVCLFGLGLRRISRGLIVVIALFTPPPICGFHVTSPGAG